ncbi:nucleoside-diphosphate sugar epimerase [Motilimonas sp. 1_MG-2023]|uniref:nucleoside-diphosphate sugar epimerase n=1 Tax=Motilimonas sp. 1_MG-2023 TaxID=3062672 RepID=UPI0026E20E98|nr:nucleoside-diphosphate sugar epimerase [Motilimonas sp. 1_MG-2023]MDO6527327.1 nucleoside-diphosphate sugar epimerase [Motilimonas sp. 1_MG-2023]
MKAVILGATGLIGHELLNLLLNAPQFTQVFAVGRRQPMLPPTTPGVEKLTYIPATIETFNHPDFFKTALPSQIDCVFCCLGTTLKAAGDKANFIAVDKTAVINFAQGCLQSNNPNLHFLLVSALGANASSPLFYSRIKGEVENALLQLKPPRLSLFRPCLLLGQRAETRTFEYACQHLFRPLASLFIGPLMTLRPIEAKRVAINMLKATTDHMPSAAKVVTNKQMHQLSVTVSDKKTRRSGF